MYNSLLIIRLCLKHMIQRLPTDEVLLHLDGATTIPQLQQTMAGREAAYTPSPPPTTTTTTTTTEGASFRDPLSLVRATQAGEVLTSETLSSIASESPIVGVPTAQLLSWRLVEGLNLILAEIQLL